MTSFTLYGIFLIGISVVAANVGLMAVRNKVNHQTLKSSHEVGGYLFAAVATLYAVLLGLIVVDAMGRYQEATHQAEYESNALSNIFLLAEQLPPPKKVEVQQFVGNTPPWWSVKNGKPWTESNTAPKPGPPA